MNSETLVFSQWRLNGITEHTNDCKGARRIGLDCLAQRDGWNRIVKLNRPAVMELISDSGVVRYVALVNLDGTQLVFKVNNQPYSFQLKEVLPFWRGFFVLFWKPPAPRIKELRSGQTLAAVQSLRDQIKVVAGFLEPKFIEKYFDDKLVTRVMEF